ncbi:hypothetical protein ILYODFUR_008552 [Ilyodon furcidens]|uniref:Secreted protein n=1 Tax=Ilyodon furcidens TaxID=33524 RepID=A0ABV0V1F1_9TELE
MVLQSVALLPCSGKVLSSTCSLGSFCVEFACSPVHVWVFSRYSGFLPQSKNMTVRFIGLSKMPLGVNGCVHGCLSCVLPCDGLATCARCTPSLTRRPLIVTSSPSTQ